MTVKESRESQNEKDHAQQKAARQEGKKTGNNPPEPGSDKKDVVIPSSDGLTSGEVEQALQEHGYNEFVEKKTHPAMKFLLRFWGPIPWMIEAAAILSAVVHHWTDFAIILVLLVGNAIVGFWEEYKADNAIEALKKKLALKARVKRDGEWKTIPSRELVPGDVIRVRIGDVVPADAQLMQGDPVEVDQSALTGESLPVTTEAGGTIYSGSVIKQGEVDAVVTATGVDTYFGKTAQMVESAKTVSHFQKAVLKVGDYLIVVAMVLIAIIIGVALFRGDSILTTVRFALVLTVAAIPVAMPTVLTVTMAVGARLLSAKQAIVSRLASVEELAGMDILCSDKTGTLTQNKLKLGDIASIAKASDQEILLAGALASREEDEDAIDLAVLAGVEDREGIKKYKIKHFQPFDPVKKRTEAEVESPEGKAFKVSKGAPQVILDLVDADTQLKEEVSEATNKFAMKGYRSLGVARTDDSGKWKYIGILSLYDPPRPDSREVVEKAREMNVNVKMVTGDQVAIGKEIASQIGLGTNLLDASGFGDTKHHETGRLAESIEKADGFAQVFPEHKYHIVDVLQQRGHYVGMTGDGVNDAPALKKADAGIAVSGATDAARSAADIVLMSSGLSVIVDAIKESRKIFQRMNSYAIYRITETIRILLFMTLSILVFNFYPVTAVMIVLLALLNDGAILSIAYDNVKGSDEPERWNMHMVLGMATLLGTAGVVDTFGLFYITDHIMHIDRNILQTVMYLKLSVAGHMTVFVTRTRGPFWSKRPSNILLLAVLGTQCLATLISVYGIFMTPIGWMFAGLVWAYAFFWFIVDDYIKRAGYRVFQFDSPGLLRAKM